MRLGFMRNGSIWDGLKIKNLSWEVMRGGEGVGRLKKLRVEDNVCGQCLKSDVFLMESHLLGYICG